jgi:predicted AlkP superfamily pyrophosphatase or phosphodiesterase
LAQKINDGARSVNRSRQQIGLLALVCLTLLTTLVGWTSKGSQARDKREPTLILISIDGFRFDYLAKYQPPNLTALARGGVRAKWMTPVYPSLTFPNHYTIATGLYPEDNGIVANDIYDPDFKATFSMSDMRAVQDGRWWGGEPIWVTAEKQGQRTGCFFFPGTETEIDGVRPTYWEHYDEKISNSSRADAVLSWLDLQAPRRPHFVTLYFSDVDTAGHHFSPYSPEVKRAIARVDRAIGRLVNGLKARGIFDQTNIIIVSDHGMAPVRPNDVVFLDQYFQTKKAERVIWGGELTQIFPKPGEESAVDSELSNGKMKHAHCYLKQDIPARFHYQNNRRIAPIICMADEGWRIFRLQKYLDERQAGKIPAHLIGAHGYDNSLPTMRATFIARGPAFKSGVVVEPFDNVNVYDIMATVLGLRPARSEGNMRVVRGLLR